MAIEVNAYYKDINNLINSENFDSSPNALIIYNNLDLGNIRGVSLAFEFRRIAFFSGRINYTLQTANGSGSGENSAFQTSWLGFETSRIIAPLNFDQRHNIVAFLDFRNGPNEGGALRDAGVNFLFRAGSGFPYTPETQHRIIIDGVPGEVPTGRRNSQYMSWTFRTDMKINKVFRFTDNLNLDVYIWVLNLLNTNNVTNVHTQSGSATSDGFLGSPGGSQLSSTTRQQYTGRLQNGFWFDTPRQVRLGVLFNF